MICVLFGVLFVWDFLNYRIIVSVCAKGKAELNSLLHLVLNSKGSAAMNTFGTAFVANPETIG